ncbi:MAG: 23S rRNA (pseudouridine(1915)-N(3))-methyltransferase RlmH [Candidatus Promineofilum sp.]|nr:23S rRNA (pseudouridine(1915)-N(3))-methyltransferase RlmH [Promineifilum sp.]
MPRPIGHITIAAVGKLREQHWQAAQEAYVHRLQHYTDFRLIEVRDVVGKAQPDAVAVAREGEHLLAAVPRGVRVVAMTADGRKMTSPEMSDYLEAQLATYGELVFLIGGPLGIDPAVAAAAPERLSLSPLTFTHEMARVILLEQLYRAFTILHGEPYHK